VAGRIRQEDVEAVRERTDIVKLVSGYLTLKKAGNDRYVGLCPFHAEKTPSFGVSPSKGMYHCFGCGEGGDAIGFLRRIEQLGFGEAVENLAREAGITVRYEGDTPAERRAASRRQALYGANEQAAELYQAMLREGKEGQDARTYLAERGVDLETAAAFGVGYAPGYPDFLTRRLARSLSTEILVEAGLVMRDSDGGVRDRFRGRITFPVHDLSGRAVGLGARVLPGEREEGPKYLNSPETPVYRKGEVLYNLHRAKGAVARTGEVHVVEGYTDVIALAQAGIETAVATCGTALGEGHFRLASRFAQRMVLAFDSDEAGARAAERAFQFLEAYSLQPVVLILPEGLDPADFVRLHGGEALRELAAKAVPLVEYMLRRTVSRFDLTSSEGRVRALEAGLTIVEGLRNAGYRSEATTLLANLANSPIDPVLMMLDSRMQGRPQQAPEAMVKRASAQERVEREMLRLLARDAETFAALSTRLEPDHFQAVRNRDLFALLLKTGGDLGAFVGRSQDEKEAKALSAIALEPLDGEASSAYAEDVWARLQEFALKRKSTALRQQLQKLNPVTDARYDDLFQQLIAIDGDLRRLRERGHVPA
jgi:DNA primase